MVSSNVWGRYQDGPQYKLWCRYADALDAYDAEQETPKFPEPSSEVGFIVAPYELHVPGFSTDASDSHNRPTARDALLYRFQMLLELESEHDHTEAWWDENASGLAMEIHFWTKVELAAAESRGIWLSLARASGYVWDLFYNQQRNTPGVQESEPSDVEESEPSFWKAVSARLFEIKK